MKKTLILTVASVAVLGFSGAAFADNNEEGIQSYTTVQAEEPTASKMDKMQPAAGSEATRDHRANTSYNQE